MNAAERATNETTDPARARSSSNPLTSALSERLGAGGLALRWPDAVSLSVVGPCALLYRLPLPRGYVSPARPLRRTRLQICPGLSSQCRLRCSVIDPEA